MDALSRLLVAIDGSPPSEVGASLATRIAASDTVATSVRFIDVAESAAARPSAQRYVDEAVAKAHRSSANADGIVREGDPASQLLEEAHAWGASCIVMGTHGREGLARAFLGSRTEAVLRGSDVPVLAVRGALGPQIFGSAIRHIVCALDASPSSEAAFATALAIARQRRALLELLTVVEIDDLYAIAYEGEGFDPQGTIDGLYAAARTHLEALAGRPDARGLRIETHVAGASRVADAIVAYAADSPADLIVVGTRGRHGAERAFLGSTAESVLRHSIVPVLAVRTAHTDPSSHVRKI